MESGDRIDGIFRMEWRDRIDGIFRMEWRDRIDGIVRIRDRCFLVEVTILVLILKRVSAEINQETIVYPRRTEIINNLGFVPWQQHVNGLQLYQDCPLDNHVCLIIPHTHSLIVNRYWHLLVNIQPKPMKFNSKCILIHFLKKTRAKVAMNRHGRSNYLIAQIINIHNLNPVSLPNPVQSCQSCLSPKSCSILSLSPDA